MKTRLALLIVTITVLVAGSLFWYVKTKPPLADEYWHAWNDASKVMVDHSLWQQVLDEYLVPDEEDVNRVDYEGLKDSGSDELTQYLDQLGRIDPRELARKEQLAYWINLYNALTLRLVIDFYPIDSITDLGETIGSFGPWDDELIVIAGKQLSLNDIEHRIIRPIYQDHRIHFAVNCASIGCPDLAIQAFTGEGLEASLQEAAEAFMRHPRAMRLSNNELVLSSIFEWYEKDFGNNFSEALETILIYAPPTIRSGLQGFQGDVTYQYNWALNEI